MWRRVVETVRPLAGSPMPKSAEPEPATERGRSPKPSPVSRPVPAPRTAPRPATTLDSGWDRRLSRGLVSPDRIVDLHEYNMASAHDLLDRRLEQAIASGARLMLLITGKPPRETGRPGARGAIRAAIGDWLAVSRHAGAIAAIRTAHPRHGGAGALYIVLRRRRERP